MLKVNKKKSCVDSCIQKCSATLKALLASVLLLEESEILEKAYYFRVFKFGGF